MNARRIDRHKTPSLICVAFLALLFGWTLISLILYCLPSSALSRAVEQTAAEWEERESVFLFLSECCDSGSAELTRSGKSLISYRAAEGVRALSFGETLSLTERSDGVTLTSPRLSAPHGAPRSALRDQFDSTGLPALLGESESKVLQAYLSFAAPEARRAFSGLSDTASTLISAASPTVTRAENTLTVGQTSLPVTDTVYSFDAEGITRAVAALQEMLSEEEKRAEFAYLSRVLSALVGTSTVLESELGDAAYMTALSESLKSDQASTLSYSVSDGRLVQLRLFLQGKVTREFVLFFGESPEATQRFFQWSETDPEGAVRTVLLEDTVLEDSDRAYIRQWTRTDSARGDVTVRFSWGREKGDLGLRFILPEREINFRGEMVSYRPEKRIEIKISRIEENKQNLIPGAPLMLTVTSEEPEPIALPAESVPIPFDDPSALADFAATLGGTAQNEGEDL